MAEYALGSRQFEHGDKKHLKIEGEGTEKDEF
jgi:hypothetical protein